MQLGLLDQVSCDHRHLESLQLALGRHVALKLYFGAVFPAFKVIASRLLHVDGGLRLVQAHFFDGGRRRVGRCTRNDDVALRNHGRVVSIGGATVVKCQVGRGVGVAVSTVAAGVTKTVRCCWASFGDSLVFILRILVDLLPFQGLGACLRAVRTQVVLRLRATLHTVGCEAVGGSRGAQVLIQGHLLKWRTLVELMMGGIVNSAHLRLGILVVPFRSLNLKVGSRRGSELGVGGVMAAVTMLTASEQGAMLGTIANEAAVVAVTSLHVLVRGGGVGCRVESLSVISARWPIAVRN